MAVATATRPRPRISLMPTMAIDAPLPPPRPVLRISEPVTAIGDRTGTPYFRYGDRADGQPETVNVSPSPGADPTRPMISTSGAVAMANGGTAIVNGYAPDKTPADFGFIPSGSPAGQRPVQVGPGTPTFDPNNPVFAAQTPNPAPNARPVIGVSSAAAPQTFDPLANIQQNQQQLIQSRRNTLAASGQTLDANGNVLQTEQGTFGPSRDVIAANSQVIGGQVRQTQGQRQLIGLQETQNDQRRAETVGIQAAAANTADQAAVAQAQQYRNTQEYRNQLAGVAPDVEVQTANGADSSALPTGVRAKLMTSQQLLQQKSDNAEALRKLDETASQLGVNLLGLDVDSLKQIAAQAGISLDLAQQAVTEAKNRAGIVGLAEDRAKLSQEGASINLAESQIKPAGQELYTSPDGQSSYVTPIVAEMLKARDQRVFDASQPSTVLYRDPYGVQPPEYISQDEANTRKIQYNRTVDAKQSGYNQANQQAIDTQLASTKYSNTTLGGIPTAQLLSFAADGTLSEQNVTQELIARGMSPTQAAIEVAGAIKTRAPAGGTQIVVPAFGTPPKP